MPTMEERLIEEIRKSEQKQDEKMSVELSEKTKAFINAIETPEKPALPEKVGYKWVLSYEFGESCFTWVSVPDQDAKGTRDNPIEWTPGIETLVNAFYIFEGNLYVCIQSGTPTDITDTDYFCKE